MGALAWSWAIGHKWCFCSIGEWFPLEISSIDSLTLWFSQIKSNQRLLPTAHEPALLLFSAALLAGMMQGGLCSVRDETLWI